VLGRFLTRLFSSLDYPTDHKLIAVGGCEAPVVSQLSTILEQQPDIRVFHSIEFLGTSRQPMPRPVCVRLVSVLPTAALPADRMHGMSVYVCTRTLLTG
jgi:hypothetical protein